VPFIVNVAMPDLPEKPTLRNFDAYYYATRAAALASAK
jgi:phosphonoacetate hydrolase